MEDGFSLCEKRDWIFMLKLIQDCEGFHLN